MKIPSLLIWRRKMIHLKLIEEILFLAEKGSGGYDAEETKREKELIGEFQKYIQGIKKTMNEEENHFMRKRIKEKVTEMNGCKLIELVADIDIVEYAYNNNVNLVDEIFDMVKNGELVEVEYILPHLSYKIKSFILPSGTDVSLGNEQELIRRLNKQIEEMKKERY